MCLIDSSLTFSGASQKKKPFLHTRHLLFCSCLFFQFLSYQFIVMYRLAHLAYWRERHDKMASSSGVFLPRGFILRGRRRNMANKGGPVGLYTLFQNG
jgi:hypothetical protein